MAISPAAQGENIGGLLGKGALDRAAEMNASKVYLESNTILKPAINLHHKLGFRNSRVINAVAFKWLLRSVAVINLRINIQDFMKTK